METRKDPPLKKTEQAEPEHDKMNYTYIVKCADGTLYTGWTNQLKERVRAHNEGRGAKYTKTRRPVELIYYETYPTKEEAMSREWHLKQLKRAEKLRLIHGWQAEKPDGCPG